MKLYVNFSALEKSVKKMGVPLIEFSVGSSKFDELDIDTILGTTGIEINLEDLEDRDGLLSYHGRQVLLYIPDQGPRINKVLEDPSQGTRFHVSDCSTLKNMKQMKRFDRYIVTNKLTGSFEVSGNDYYTSEAVTGTAGLKVCKNCLKELNYNGYASEGKRLNVFNKFTLETFFENYSTLFEHMPRLENKLYSSTYTDDWKEVSRFYREKMRYKCEACETSFLEDKKLLHVHHINGVKDDNTQNNLKAVCIDCHRKEPNHSHIMLTQEKMRQIYRLRRDQGKADVSKSWERVYALADLSLHGYLKFLQSKQPQAIPEVGYFMRVGREEIMFDLAWVNYKRAVVTKANKPTNVVEGWIVKEFGDVLEGISS